MLIERGHVNLYRYNGSKCPICGRFIELRNLYSEYYAVMPIAGTFRNAISFKEYEISGMCQSCQDMIYGVDE
jgi:hypothetical protein